MNKQERDYAAKRVEQILRQKTYELGQKPSLPSLSKADLKAFVLSGKAVIKNIESEANYDGTGSKVIYVRYVHPDFTKAQVDAIEKKRSIWEGKCAELRRVATEVTDEIMLGDSQRALDLLKSFENSK